MSNFFKDKLKIDIPVRRTFNSVFNRDEEEEKKRGMVFPVGENLTPQQTRTARAVVSKPSGQQGNFFASMLKETPRAAAKVGQEIIKFGQSVTRNTGSLGITAYNKRGTLANNFFASLLPGGPANMIPGANPISTRTKPLFERFNTPDGPQILQPDNTFHKVVFGNEPVKSVELRSQENRAMVQDFGKRYDVPFIKTDRGSMIAGAAIPVASILSDLTGPGKKKALQEGIEAIAKTKNLSIIERTLKQLGVADDAVKSLAPKLTTIDDPKRIKDILNQSKETIERGFVTSVKESPKVTSATKKAINELPDETLRYTRETDAEALKRAQARITDNEQEALGYVLNSDKPDKDVITTGIELMRKYRAAKNVQAEVEVAANLAEKGTKAGQTVQAFSIFENLSPEGVLVYAQRQIKKANAKKLFPQLRKTQELTPDQATKIRDLAEKADQITDPILKQEATAEVQAALASLTNAGAGRMISTIQTMAQLLNPKTMVRNTLGNEIFWRLERINRLVATPIDMARSKITGGPRTVTFRTGAGVWQDFLSGGRSYFTGLKKGASSGFRGAMPVATQMDFNPGLTFKGKWNPLSWFERTMKAGLSGFDYASFSRARDRTIGELAWLRAINEGKKGAAAKAAAERYAKEIDDTVLEIANNYGKYVTYQDENIISKGLSKVKRGLNLGKEFGAGDLVIKYPKTPGAILMRGLEYSPVGVLKAMYELVEPFAHGGRPDPAKITMSLSRAITGSVGLTAMGYYLADKGIITGKPVEDFDLQAAQKETGTGKYQVNLSALKRFVISGFKETSKKEGDVLYSYDWAQPVAMMLAIGANANQNVQAGDDVTQNLPGTVLNSLEGGFETLTEQPVLTGITRLLGGHGGPVGVITDTAKQLPASFAPTILNQANQLMDNRVRSTYDPNPLKEAWNRAKAKIPGAAQTLPERKTIFGETEQRFQDGTNNIINVFLNPGFVKKYKQDPEIKMVMDIFESSGETKQAPRIVETSQKITVDGKTETRKISPKEQEALQATIGNLTQYAFRKIATEQADRFSKETPQKQAEILAGILSDISQAAKIQIVGHRPDPKGVSDRTKKYIKMLKEDPELSPYLFTRTGK